MNLIIAGANKIGEYLVRNYSQFGLRHDLIGFVDDNRALKGKQFAGLSVIGNVEAVLDIEKVALVLAVDTPSQKMDIVRRLLYHPSLEFPNLFSGNAWVSKDCIFGRGNVILDGSLINFGTQIGDFNIIDQNCSIGHEAVIGDFSYLAESVSVGGYSFLEDSEVIRKEAVISQGVRIGRNSEIGSGCRIETDLPAESKIADRARFI